MNGPSPQLPLALNLPDDETFESFFVGQNDALVGNIEQLLQGSLSARTMLIVGQKGTGKSHILHASCSAFGEDKAAYCISLSDHESMTPELFDNLEQGDLICIDNIELIAGKKEWEQALFDLYNRVVEQGSLLLMSASVLPTDMNVALPDLLSRLQWGLVEQVKTLNDEDKCQALQLRATARGIKLADDAAHFLLTHYSRDMKALLQSLDRLDKASMREMRKLTIPFIKETLDT